MTCRGRGVCRHWDCMTESCKIITLAAIRDCSLPVSLMVLRGETVRGWMGWGALALYVDLLS